MVLLGDEAQVEGLSVRLEIVLILTQVRCIVCAKHTRGSEIILVAPIILLDDEAQVEAHFSPF
jgi:hypothetical protein